MSWTNDEVVGLRMTPRALSLYYLFTPLLAFPAPPPIASPSLPLLRNLTRLFPLLAPQNKPPSHSPTKLLTLWPTTPFDEYIYEPDEYLTVLSSWPSSQYDDPAPFLASIAKIAETVCPPSMDDTPVTHVHVTETPLVFELQTTTRAPVMGWKVWEILYVAGSVEARYGGGTFLGRYVKDGVALAEVSLLLVGEGGGGGGSEQ